MPLAQSWYLQIEDGYIFVNKGNHQGSTSLDSSGVLASATSSATAGPVLKVREYEDTVVKFKIINGEPRGRALKDFTWEKSQFSRIFKNARSAKDFVAIWDREVKPNLDARTGAYTPVAQPITPRATPPSTPDILPASKRMKQTDHNDAETEMDEKIEASYQGCYEVSVSCLVEPSKENTLREPDPIFIENLKKEMLDNPTKLVSPIVALVRLTSGESYDSKHPNSFKYETVGGNNSRIALQYLNKAFPENQNYQTRLVAVYANLTSNLALRLAARHNRATDFTHSMKTQDKVATCRRRYAHDVSKQEWRRSCSAILSQSITRLDDSMVLFLASLPDEEYDIVLGIFELYEACNLKDQKLSRTQRGTMINSKLDCKGVHFKPLRGLEPNSRKVLLQQVLNKELSFPELASSCKYIKQMEAIKAQFLKYMGMQSWEAATEKFPEHTKKERLEPFLDMTFKKDVPPLFITFCKQAKCESFSRSNSTNTPQSRGDNVMCIEVQQSTAVLLKHDVLEVEDRDLVSSVTPFSCNGFNLTILDPPEDWSTDNILLVCRLVRSVNAALGMQNYNVALFVKPDNIIDSLMKDFTTQVVYYTNSRIENKDNRGKLLMSVFPIVLCHWTTSSGDLSCYPKQSSFNGNLLTVDDSPSSPLQGRAIAKPDVYKALVNLLSLDGQWVLDPLGGNGVVSVSSLQCSRNCVACEPQDDYMGIMYHKLLEEKEKIENISS